MRIMRSHWVTVPNGETGNEANERWCVCFRAWSCDCSLLLTSLLRTGFYKVYFILIVALCLCVCLLQPEVDFFGRAVAPKIQKPQSSSDKGTV